MTRLTLAVLSLTLLGSSPGHSLSAPSRTSPAALPPQVVRAALQPELSAPMFHGTVQRIDRQALRVTIRTDFGRLVPVTVGNCELIQRLKIGDRVRLDVDAQGVVRALEQPGASPSATPGKPRPSAWRPEPCGQNPV